MNELLARVKAVLKRHNISATIISYKNFHLDFENRNLTYENIKISLTPSEFRLLEMFFKNQKRTLSRDEIMENLEIQNEKSVNVAINRLNHKIGNIIESVRGIGYKLK
jgi:DNA-binding response OmpR family regulator